MRKILLVLLMMMIMIMSVSCGSYDSEEGSFSESEKSFSISLTPHMNDITVEWNDDNKINKYVIYRVDVTEDVLEPEKDMTFDLSKYEKIAEVSSGKSSYVDKSVNPNHYYAYVVKAYQKVKEKNRLVYMSDVYEDQYMAQCCGLSAPDLLNGGYGEFSTNSKDGLYLYFQVYYGVEPTSVILYRRAEDEEEYQKIDFETIEEICEGSGEIKDSSVEPGVIYYYKIKTVRKDDGKEYYSKKSDYVRIPAVNWKGEYTVSKELVSADPDKVIIKLKSDKYNGRLTISQMEFDSDDAVQIVAYSFDHEVWKSMKDQELVISPGDTVFLQFEGKEIADAQEIYLDSDNGAVCLNYDGPGAGIGIMSISFDSKTAEVYQNYD
ncbi:hypothetical protein [Eubacterium oxidoreducens]|uniref:Fibronectin type-III domain-containing protein n=1 Tax=Eubacterium oxidoreducens TaxID=1732 RepID=A0A1G6BIK1_EUBOX|nr:hypothetical protein [Eubacterium oxidoreducens]SDB20450.1 hypothetical protein SAMN02910417_01560 [Eubacterium oxidoreducens]